MIRYNHDFFHKVSYFRENHSIFISLCTGSGSVSLIHYVEFSTNIWFSFAEVHSENETTGYIVIHAEGGLNQQRIAVCFLLTLSPITYILDI